MPQLGLRPKTLFPREVIRKDSGPAAEKSTRWVSLKSMRLRDYRKVFEPGERKNHAIFANCHTIPASELLLRNVACNWWYIPSRGWWIVPTWWAIKHRMLHDLVPVNPMNNASPSIKIAAFQPGNVRVDPLTEPRDQLDSIRIAQPVSFPFRCLGSTGSRLGIFGLCWEHTRY